MLLCYYGWYAPRTPRGDFHTYMYFSSNCPDFMNEKTKKGSRGDVKSIPSCDRISQGWNWNLNTICICYAPKICSFLHVPRKTKAKAKD